MIKDFYFSKSMSSSKFDFAESDLLYGSYGTTYVCEVFINGKWKMFVEQIEAGREPVLKNRKDLEFVGTQDDKLTRYTPINKWISSNLMKEVDN